VSDFEGSVRATVIPPGPVEPEHDLGAVLRIAPFRKLWVALSFSSLGDWLGLLATTALASQLSGAGYAQQSFAIAGVFLLRLAPAVLFGPIAGVVADRLDRRWTMVVCDLLRFALFFSIPLVGTLWWLYAATFLVEAASLFWIPAKEATVPNLVPKERLESANQLSLVTTYGTAPVAAAVFTTLSLLNSVAASVSSLPSTSVDLALYFDALTFLFSAITIYRLRSIPKAQRHPASTPSVLRTVVEGWKFVGHTKLIRGLIIGILGACAAGGMVVGLAKRYVSDLHAGNAAYGVLFGTVFLGMAAGMFLGPRLLAGFSRRRLFGLAIVGAGLSLSLLALVPNLVIVVLLTWVLGALTGVAWVTGYTLLGLEVQDELRGRTFAFVQSLVRVTLILVLAVAPLIAGPIGVHVFKLTDETVLTYNGAAITLFLAGLVAVCVGVVALRQMDDRRGIPLAADLIAAVRGQTLAARGGAAPGYFIALEGGEGAGKSTQAARLAEWLRDKGHEVVLTQEPGATDVGKRLRALLLDLKTAGLSARAEALLYAADRAEHVHAVIRPALRRGAVVVSDRYVDSSIAYQGAGRALPGDQVARISRWATAGLQPNLTVLLDVPPGEGLRRFTEPADRLESEPLQFHERVRRGYLDLAAQQRHRYLVVDATQSPETVLAAIQARLQIDLPLSETERRRRETDARLAREREDAARTADEARRAEQQALVERCRKESEQRRREEAKRRAAEEAARRAEEQRLRAEQERLRAEQEAARRAEEQRLRAEQERLRAEQEAARRAEEQRLRAEQEWVHAEQEAARRADQQRRRADEQRRRAERDAARRGEREAARRAEEQRLQAEAQAARGARISQPQPETTQILPSFQDGTEVLPQPGSRTDAAATPGGQSDPEALAEEQPSLADELLGPWPAWDEEQEDRGGHHRHRKRGS
jgi:dTMP kinase